MAGEIKGLVKDTAVYGLASIGGRFVNWLLVPIYTYVLQDTAAYGVVTNLYAWTGLLLIILTYGMETGFFRYMNRDTDPRSVYSTSLWSLGVSSALFVLVGLIFLDPISSRLGYPDKSELVGMLVVIVAMDAFMAIPFAYLRYANRPWRFAGLRFLFIGLNIGLNLFFLILCPWLMTVAPSLVSWFFRPEYAVGYIFVSNLIATSVQLLFILPYCRTGFTFRPELLRRILSYSFPIMLLGLAGNFNKMADKILFPFLISDRVEAESQLGIYGACFKIAVVMVMFTQAFRYAYEPFIFKKKAGQDSYERSTYAKAMKYYLIFSLLIFLGMMAYLDVLKFFVHKSYHAGLAVVPLVMLGELMFGIYFNLSVWYKLTDRTYWGAILSGMGCALTVRIIVWGVPRYGFMACAWASLISNAAMMLCSYFLGKRYYPVPYYLGSAGRYVLIASGLYAVMIGFGRLLPHHPHIVMLLNTLPLAFFVYYITRHDVDLTSIPYVGKFFRR